MFTSSIDWQPSLKPRIRPTKSKLDHLYGLDDEAKEPVERPSERHQCDETYPSADTSGGAAVTAERMTSP